MHLLGMQGMPRRIAVYAPEYQLLNVVETVAAYVLGFSTLLVVVNVVHSLRNGKRAGPNPWRALTLEWATTSPPPPHNFSGEAIPFVDPYGYGTQESLQYLAAIDRLYGPSHSDVPEPEPAQNAEAVGTP
jgi:cytochrome c oxidase subunit I